MVLCILAYMKWIGAIANAFPAVTIQNVCEKNPFLLLRTQIPYRPTNHRQSYS